MARKELSYTRHKQLFPDHRVEWEHIPGYQMSVWICHDCKCDGCFQGKQYFSYLERLYDSEHDV